MKKWKRNKYLFGYNAVNFHFPEFVNCLGFCQSILLFLKWTSAGKRKLTDLYQINKITILSVVSLEIF